MRDGRLETSVYLFCLVTRIIVIRGYPCLYLGEYMNNEEYKILLRRCEKQLESVLVEIRAALRTTTTEEQDHSESKERWIAR